MARNSDALASLPVLVMPITVISNSSGSRALMTEAADVKETSCSPDLPPNTIPSLVFRALVIIAVSLGTHLVFCMLLVGLDDQAY